MNFVSPIDFWVPRKRRKGVMPPIPVTGWHAPREFPNLSGERVLAIDTETHDPNLKTKGPGWARGDGTLVGVSLATQDKAWYFPFGHTVATDQNLDRGRVIKWLKDVFAVKRDYIGANLQYDVGWLRESGVLVNHRRLLDIQNAEPLLDEYAFSYSLNALSDKYLGESKVSELLYEWCADAYGGKPTARAQGRNIHRAPPCVVGPYAEADASLPFRIYAKQRKELMCQELLGVFDLETKLLPLLIDMRFRGVRVDLVRARELDRLWTEKERTAQRALNELAQTEVDVWANASIASAFQRLNMPFVRTAKGAPSFTKEWLAKHDSDVARAILGVRRYSKARTTFIEGYVLDKHVDGIIHANFHQLRRVSDETGGVGTVSGRFSSSNPNLQNPPSRDPEIGPAIRSMFVPHEGDRQWRSYDHSQVEYRGLLHYAMGPGAAEARQKFWDDPGADFHEEVRQEIYQKTGRLIDRKPTKNVNFGLIYGMGKPKLSRQLGMALDEAKELFEAYHEGVPFAKVTFDRFVNRAASRGYIITLLGRRARFPFWEPADWSLKDFFKPTRDREDLLRRIDEQREIERKNGNEVPRGGVKRANTHKALNAGLQGSAADIMKKNMADMLEAGVFDYTGLPTVTVHDELGFSDPGTRESEEAFKEVERIMVDVDLRVPLKVDCSIGPNWGEVK